MQKECPIVADIKVEIAGNRDQNAIQTPIPTLPPDPRLAADHDMTHCQDNEPAFAPKCVIHDRKAMANSTPRNPPVVEIPMTVAALLEVATGALANPGFAPTAGALLLDAVATGLILFGRAV